MYSRMLEWPGAVARDDATQSVLVKARLRNQPPSLRVLQYARARIVWSNDPALTIPVVAVNRLGGQ